MFSAANRTYQLQFNLSTANRKEEIWSHNLRIFKFSFLLCPGGIPPFVTPFYGSLSFSIIITSPILRALDFTATNFVLLSVLI